MTWLQTASGRKFDLLAPTPEMVDFAIDIPEALAALARFNGHVRAGVYSVAQHCCLGADFLEKDTGRIDLAFAFLLHDAHEAYLGDMILPASEALCEVHMRRGCDGANFRSTLTYAKFLLDGAIYPAAGLSFPLSPATQKVIKDTDLRLMMSERRDLLTKPPAPWALICEAAAPLPIPRIRIWPRGRAIEEWKARFALWSRILARRNLMTPEGVR